jgi:hypothetical protein
MLVLDSFRSWALAEAQMECRCVRRSSGELVSLVVLLTVSAGRRVCYQVGGRSW